MGNSRSLTDEENARVVAAMKDLQQRPEYKTQTPLAEDLGVKQPSISAILRGDERAGIGIAMRVAMLKGMALQRLLGHYGDDVYPNRAAVLDLLRPELSPDVIKRVCAVNAGEDGDRPMWWWAQHIASEQMQFIEAKLRSKSSSTQLTAQSKRKR